MKFRKQINNKYFIVGDPTMRQNEEFLSLCISNNIDFEKVSQNFDFGSFLIKVADQKLLREMYVIMIHPEGEVYRKGQVDLEDIADLTETEMKLIFDEFFSKKKALINGFLKFLQNTFLSLMTKFLMKNLNNQQATMSK